MDQTMIVMRTCLKNKILSDQRDKTDNANNLTKKIQIKMSHTAISNAVEATLKAKRVKLEFKQATGTKLKTNNSNSMLIKKSSRLRTIT